MKKKYIWRLIFFLLLISIGYLGFQVYLATDNSVVTQVAIEQTFSDSILTEGIAVRDETVIPYTAGAVLSFLQEDGERVSEGDVIANIYASVEDAENSAKAERVLQEADLMSELLNTYVNYVPDIQSISKQQFSDYYDLLNVINSGEYEDVSAVKNNLLYDMTRLQLATEIPADVETRLNSLALSAQTLGNSAMPTGTIISPNGGHFVGTVDGFESSYTEATASEWSITSLQNAIEVASQSALQSDVAGKIILDYRWSFYCILPSDEAAKLRVGNDYYVLFTAVGGEEIKCTLESVDEADEDGNTLLVLSCDTLNEHVASLRYSEADIIIKNYYGIRVSRDALRIVDGQKGVYVKYGNLLQFKNINPIFETENYLLLPMEQSSDNEVKLYDEIVVEGRNLYDGKNL